MIYVAHIQPSHVADPRSTHQRLAIGDVFPRHGKLLRDDLGVDAAPFARHLERA